MSDLTPEQRVIEAAKEFVREETHVQRDGMMIAHTKKMLVAAVRALEESEREDG